MRPSRIVDGVANTRLRSCPEDEEKTMTKHRNRWIMSIALIGLVLLGLALVRPREVKAQGQYPMVDSIANKIVQKYTSSSCEQLWMKKSEHAPPSVEEQRAIGVLRNDPQMRAEFINRIAAPIANKMFDCGMVP
jgi:hypothetical protein